MISLELVLSIFSAPSCVGMGPISTARWQWRTIRSSRALLRCVPSSVFQLSPESLEPQKLPSPTWIVCQAQGCTKKFLDKARITRDRHFDVYIRDPLTRASQVISIYNRLPGITAPGYSDHLERVRYIHVAAAEQETVEV